MSASALSQSATTASGDLVAAPTPNNLLEKLANKTEKEARTPDFSQDVILLLPTVSNFRKLTVHSHPFNMVTFYIGNGDGKKPMV